MLKNSDRAAYLAWSVLMISTLVSWALASDHGDLFSDRVVTGSVVIGIAFLKVYLVGRYFMDLRLAPLNLRLPFNLWGLATATLVIALYAGT